MSKVMIGFAGCLLLWGTMLPAAYAQPSGFPRTSPVIRPDRLDAGPRALETGPTNWRLQLERIRVERQQESGSIFTAGGDEPYFIVIRFRSRFSTPNSTEVTWGGHLAEVGEDMKRGAERDIPPAMGLVEFRNVHIYSKQQILKENKLPEFMGAIVICMESDATPWRIIRSLAERIRGLVEVEVRELVEKGRLNLASEEIAQAQLSEAVNRVRSRVRPRVVEALGIWAASLTDPDDQIDVHTFVFAAVGPDVKMNFTTEPKATVGRLTTASWRIGANPIIFSGDGATYAVSASLK